MDRGWCGIFCRIGHVAVADAVVAASDKECVHVALSPLSIRSCGAVGVYACLRAELLVQQSVHYGFPEGYGERKIPEGPQ